jgi:hypothetical protein
MVGPDYYTTNNINKTNNKKTGDFLIGFLGTWIVTGILTWLILFIFQNSTISMWYSRIWYILPILIFIATTIFSFKKNRRYIGIGAICAALVPLLVWGACAAFFTLL